MSERILVIGDIMLDKYTVGDVERISPEAPVPVVKVTEEYSSLGGCGNVVRNIASMKVKVDCVASIGYDHDGASIAHQLEDHGVGNYLVFQSEVTTVKERVVANSRKIQMIRVDREIVKRVPFSALQDKLKNYFSFYDPSIVVISDYAKGMITKELMNYLTTQMKEIIVDPKPVNGHIYGSVFMLTPNEKEWKEMMLTTPRTDLNSVNYVLITKGKEGMTLFDFEKSINIPAEDTHMVYNVSGAGDTVLATMAVCLSKGLDPVISAKIANACASYVVTQPGTSTIPYEVFQKCLQKYGG
jgi:rfaE bifunctional protein kinase chain/domain